MKEFSAKHPIVFGAILFIIALIAALIPTAVLQMVGFTTESAAAVGRLIVGIILLAIFRSSISWESSFKGLRWALPALLIVVWNIALELIAGNTPVGPAGIVEALLLGLAPAIFEESIFRIAVIGKLREGGRGAWHALWASSLLFAAIHLTNAVGGNIANTLVQVVYSLAIGLFLGAIYLKTGDAASAILAHAAIDVSNQIFTASPTSADVPMICAFCAVLVILTAYALWLAKGLAKDGE